MSLHIPATVVPFRYSVTFPACNPLDFGTERADLVRWDAERSASVWRLAKADAEARVRRAEADGSAEGTTDHGDVYVVEAWQSTVLQGEADDADEYLAATYPVGTPVTATEAFSGALTYGRVAAYADRMMRVEWVDGSTTEGRPFDMARMLDATTELSMARVEAAHASVMADHAEAARISEAAREAVAQADAERAARVEAERVQAEAERGYVVTTAPVGDNRTEGLRRMTLAEATATALSAEGMRRGARILPATEGDRFPEGHVFAVPSAERRYAVRTTSSDYRAGTTRTGTVDPGWTATLSRADAAAHLDGLGARALAVVTALDVADAQPGTAVWADDPRTGLRVWAVRR